MKKLLIAFLLLASVCGAQTLSVPNLSTSMPKFMAYANANNPAGSAIAASYSAVVYDTNSGFDGVSTYTIPLAGYYRVTVHNSLYSGGAGGYGGATLVKNGTTLAYDAAESTAGTSFNSAVIDVVLSLSAGDKLSVTTFAAAGGSLIGDTYYRSWFSVVKIP
jgi:hypothetical protein